MCVAHVLVCTVATQVLQYIRQNLKKCHHRVPGSNRWDEHEINSFTTKLRNKETRKAMTESESVTPVVYEAVRVQIA